MCCRYKQNMNYIADEDNWEDAIEKLDLIIAELEAENAVLREENRRLFKAFRWLSVWLSSQS